MFRKIFATLLIPVILALAIGQGVFASDIEVEGTKVLGDGTSTQTVDGAYDPASGEIEVTKTEDIQSGISNTILEDIIDTACAFTDIYCYKDDFNDDGKLDYIQINKATGEFKYYEFAGSDTQLFSEEYHSVESNLAGMNNVVKIELIKNILGEDESIKGLYFIYDKGIAYRSLLVPILARMNFSDKRIDYKVLGGLSSYVYNSYGASYSNLFFKEINNKKVLYGYNYMNNSYDDVRMILMFIGNFDGIKEIDFSFVDGIHFNKIFTSGFGFYIKDERSYPHYYYQYINYDNIVEYNDEYPYYIPSVGYISLSLGDYNNININGQGEIIYFDKTENKYKKLKLDGSDTTGSISNIIGYNYKLIKSITNYDSNYNFYFVRGDGIEAGSYGRRYFRIGTIYYIIKTDKENNFVGYTKLTGPNERLYYFDDDWDYKSITNIDFEEIRRDGKYYFTFRHLGTTPKIYEVVLDNNGNFNVNPFYNVGIKGCENSYYNNSCGKFLNEDSQKFHNFYEIKDNMFFIEGNIYKWDGYKLYLLYRLNYYKGGEDYYHSLNYSRDIYNKYDEGENITSISPNILVTPIVSDLGIKEISDGTTSIILLGRRTYRQQEAEKYNGRRYRFNNYTNRFSYLLNKNTENFEEYLGERRYSSINPSYNDEYSYDHRNDGYLPELGEKEYDINGMKFKIQ